MRYEDRVHMKLAELELKVEDHLRQSETNTDSFNLIEGARQAGVARGILTAIKEIRKLKD